MKLCCQSGGKEEVSVLPCIKHLTVMEISSASTFLSNMLQLYGRGIPAARVEGFRRTMEEVLRHHYQHHWFPEKPSKGSGYRCLRINHKMDPLISKAGSICGFDEAQLRQILPKELTMWIDPLEVSYRIGENGSICVLYEGKKNQHSTDVNQCSPSYPPTNESRYPGCKESVRCSNSWDGFVMDTRNISLEQIAAYVSS